MTSPQWAQILGMLQVYVPSIGLFFLGGILGHGLATRVGVRLQAEWGRWMTTLYLFSLLIPLPLWVQGSLFYENIWIVYALLSLLMGIARGLSFPARQQRQQQVRQRLQQAQERIAQILRHHEADKPKPKQAGTLKRHV